MTSSRRTHLEAVSLNQAKEFLNKPVNQCDHVAYLAFINGFNYAMSLVESRSIYEHALGKMTDETYEFIKKTVKLGEQP